MFRALTLWGIAPNRYRCLTALVLGGWAFAVYGQSVPDQRGGSGGGGAGDAVLQDQGSIHLQRAQGEPLTYPVAPVTPEQVSPPAPLLPRESVPVPDRWRIMEALGLLDQPFNPYAVNTLKGDKPFAPLASLGPDWFVNLGIISDTLFEARRLPTPIAPSAQATSGSNDVFGRARQSTFNQDLIVSFSVIKGDTTFRPPDYEFHFEPVFNANQSQVQEAGVLNANPQDGLVRRDRFIGVQQAYAEAHLRDVSERYDFDSLRVGIQPFTADFRGFLFQDDALGVRLSGTRDSNRWQYNLAWLRRLEKDTNSGLNDVGVPMRRDESLVANLYRQDFPIEGNTTELVVLHNINNDTSSYYDSNGFLERPAAVGDERPHHYEVTYYGLNTDGHFGRWNLTSSFYGVYGFDSHNPIAQRAQTIEAGFAAFELSRDFDWIRVRANGLVASGDRNPYGSRATGYDSVIENPDFAGADTSFWIRQGIPLIGGGGVSLSGRNGVLADLRSSKDDGQSNFVNPGLTLWGFGADFDVLPQLRILTNVSKLDFVNTTVLEVLRQQANISRNIGVDVSAGIQYRPSMSQNIVLNASIAALFPGRGMKQLFDTNQLGTEYSLLFNLILRY